MKKLFYLLTFSLICFWASNQALAQNSTTYSTQMKRCMTPTIIDKNTVALSANQIPTSQMVYVVDCMTTNNDFVCTTGNKEADKVLKITSPNATQKFVLSKNPVEQKVGNSFKTEATVDFSGNKTHVFMAIVLMNPNQNMGNGKALSFGNINFFDQNLAECTAIRGKDEKVVPLSTFGAMRNTNQTIILGQAAPLSTIEITQKDTVLTAATANTYGEYSALIDNRKIEQTEKINIIVAAKNTRSSLENKFVAYAQGTKKATFMIDPIFSNMEGYAYDTAGKIVPNAVVNIKLKNSSDIYYSTTANEKGFFKIASEFLPIYAYDVEVKNSVSGKTTKTTTTEFAKSNLEYLIEKNINLVVYAKASVNSTNEAKVNVDAQKPVAKSLKSPLTEPSSIMFTLLTLFVIICVIGITLFFLYKNNLHEDKK